MTERHLKRSNMTERIILTVEREEGDRHTAASCRLSAFELDAMICGQGYWLEQAVTDLRNACRFRIKEQPCECHQPK